MTSTQQNPVTIYTKDNCAYCVRAKIFFKEHDISYEEIYISEIDEMIRLKKKFGWATFPIIIINEKVIGGYDDLKALSESGQLEPLLGRK